MKKKHLKSLETIEKWLREEIGVQGALIEAFQTIREGIDRVADVPENDESSLPKPSEISAEPNMLALYSDGGCRGNPGPGAYAFVIQEHNGKVLLEGVDFESLTTNNRMELSGPLKGLTELKASLPALGKDPRLTKVKVITDSKYVVDGMKSWVAGWKSRDWKKADKKAPENLELWKGLDLIRDEFLSVEWMWVKGHGGHPQNEYCDKKANEVMDARIS